MIATLTRKKVWIPLVLFVAALAGGLALAGRAMSESEPADGVAVHKVNQDPAAVSSYWTEERMRGAKPAPMPSPED